MTTIHRSLRSSHQDREAGETLAEVLVAVVILAIAITVLVGGLLEGAMSSDRHRKAATADTIVRSYAESLQAAVSQSNPPSSWCSSAQSFTYPATPAGYTVGQQADPCPAGPTVPKFITVTITASSKDGRDTETLKDVVRKP
jgi:Tfp pilus assembly protein PilV